MATAVSHQLEGRFANLTMNRLGLWLFIVSDASFFLALLSSRFFVVGTDTPDHVDQPLGLVLTGVLLLSSLTAYSAESASRHGDQLKFRRYLLATIVLGVLFIAGVGYEWKAAFEHFGPTTGYGTVFFTLTGIHATHVLTGLIVLAIVYFKGRKGRYGPDDYWPVEGAVKWWHFVDVAWVFIYPTLYLVS